MKGEPLFAVPKPGKGSQQKARIQQTLKAESAEVRAKVEAKKRDGHTCRWPHSRGEVMICRRMRLESAHYLAKSRGGANTTENLITFCVEIHQGPVSLHSGDLRVIPLTRDRMDGPVRFMRKVGRTWVEVGRESSIGVLERKP